ncbi:MAG: STAS domain-containing protein [Methanomicrobiales archaeon]|nr:STAS domain-containing protein [Methanomicrobiales archaeon]
MQVTTEKTGNRLLLRAGGRFDAAGAKVIGDALEQALTSGSHTVEIDMGGVDYLSSAGIRVLVTYSQKFTKLKGGLYLTSVNERISQLLEMTGLYNLLDNPEPVDGAGACSRALTFGGWTLTSRSIDPDGKFSLRHRGYEVVESPVPAEPASPEVLAFPAGTIAFGTGALGYDAADCTGRYGPFLAAGGYAACRPLAGDNDPDFEEYAEAYIPKLHVISGAVLTGSFAQQVAFESDGTPPVLSDLAGSFATLCGTPATAFVLAAECEITQGSALLSGSARPEGTDKTALTGSDGSRLCLVLAGGMTGRDGQIAGVHAVFFTYQPLRRHGRVKLKDTADALFGQDLLDVLPIAVLGESTPVPELRLLRGLAWIAPLGDAR